MIRLLKFFWWSFVAVICALVLGVSGAFLYLSPSLPSVDALRSIQLQIPLRVYSSDGKLIAEFGEMRRSPIRFEEIPPQFIQALLSAEDDNFLNHYGVDPGSLMRAATQLLKSGHIQTGGSTITMQVAKNFFLSSERSFSRKTTEILLALQIERELTKDEILELYVNKIYLGNRAYGIEAAAQVYYGKSIRDVSLAQMAMIAGLPKAPSRFNPLANPIRAKERRDWILGRMYRLGKIDQASYQAALAEPLNASYHVPTPEVNAPWIAEMARAEMVGRYGSDAYTEGFRVTTTVPSDLQEMANDAVRDGLASYDERHGYRGPEARFPGKDIAAWQQALNKQRSLGGLEPAIVTQVEKTGLQVLMRDGKQEHVAWETMKWARPFINTNSLGRVPRGPADVAEVGDLVRLQRLADGTLKFSQVPGAQSALVTLDPYNGAIRALVGGFSFEQSNYNRAMQAKRQPGSSFKPFIYSAALDNGYTAASLVNDAPIVFVDDYLDKVWRPKNDTNTFLGPIRMREALYKSRNLVSIRLLQSMGVDRTIDYIAKFGFNKQDLPRNLSLALGTATLTPMEIATGWSTFANGGYKISPYLIERIESRTGETLFTANPARVPQANQDQAGIAAPEQPVGVQLPGEAMPADAKPAAAPQVAERIVDGRTTYILTSMLQDVIKRGTGRRAMALGRNDLAGKTGTTNESKDAWFSGYNADYITTVWTGFDQPETLGRREYGGTVALPIWMKFMGAALKDKPSHPPAEPEGILSLRVDPVSGRAATPSTPNAYFELFKAEDSPPSSSELGNGVAPGSPLPADEAAPMDLF
ncbi:penicillin-binding protein 1A [Pseudomonas fulva]|nr:penicillin-binding protein 1A [Pseudomonas fulva]MBF8778791.1 penicillin-binding protein 1A [Pseudomonas fulva]